jgi:hypothetical protein
MQVNFVVMNKVGGMLQRVDYVRKVRLPKLSAIAALIGDVLLLWSHALLPESCCRCVNAWCLLTAAGVLQYGFAVMCILKNEKGEFPIR